jgi:hypothetical protein
LSHIPSRKAAASAPSISSFAKEDSSKRRRHLGDRRRLAQLLRRHRLPLDEGGDEAGRALQQRHHFGPDARRRGQFARRPLRPPVDPEQLGVLPRQPHDHVLAGEPDPVVAVGDPAVKRHRLAFELAEAGRERSERVCQRGHLGSEEILPVGIDRGQQQDLGSLRTP